MFEAPRRICPHRQDQAGSMPVMDMRRPMYANIHLRARVMHGQLDSHTVRICKSMQRPPAGECGGECVPLNLQEMGVSIAHAHRIPLFVTAPALSFQSSTCNTCCMRCG